MTPVVTVERVRSVAIDLVGAAPLTVMQLVQLALSHRYEERRQV